MALAVTLLGPPRIERDGQPVAVDTRKATALLAHLALADRPRSRDALCALLWPAHDSGSARGALRRTLSTLRTAVGEQWIDTSGDSIALRRGPGLELDVERFRGWRRMARRSSLSEAVGCSPSKSGLSRSEKPSRKSPENSATASLRLSSEAPSAASSRKRSTSSSRPGPRFRAMLSPAVSIHSSPTAVRRVESVRRRAPRALTRVVGRPQQAAERVA